MPEQMVTSAELHATFSLLGSRVGETYQVSEGCFDKLLEILFKLINDDHVCRPYRRAIGFSLVVKKDLLPLMSATKDDPKIFDIIVRILVTLTVPVESLLDVTTVLKTKTGRGIVFDLNWLLTSCKEAFIDPKSTRVILDYMKSVLDKEGHLSIQDCDGINNCLILLRNILHIPEVRGGVAGNVSHQNQVVWNIFAQNMDKVLIELMTSTYRAHWSIIVVQLVALMYRDQFVVTLQKMLNQWFEASLSESSEDNESNTSPPEQGSGDSSSSNMMSDPTSDSSDNGGNSKPQRKISKMEGNDNMKMSSDNKQVHMMSRISDRKNQAANRKHFPSSKMQNKKDRSFEGIDNNHFDNKNEQFPKRAQSNVEGFKVIEAALCYIEKAPAAHAMLIRKRRDSGSRKRIRQDKQSSITKNNKKETSSDSFKTSHHSVWSWTSSESGISASTNTPKKECLSSEVSDCGYGTQVENQESISTSSNEEDGPNRNMKPVHQKPSNLIHKSRYHNGKSAPMLPHERKEWRRKKLIKRSRTNIMNMKALLHHSPSDDDISQLLKEFTVDFLLKGYACLFQDLRAQLLTNIWLHIDTSHFFWLISYFLKFAAQLELDFEHISPVLSFDTVAYLTYEGVRLCEELELSRMQPHIDVTPCVLRMHLVVAAIREIIHCIEVYKKLSHLSQEDEERLLTLQNKICSIEDLRCLFVLLIRQYDPAIQSKQYLQDIIITNHILLLFLENSNKASDDSCHKFHKISMTDHISQFASMEIMKQYGVLLESFEENGEFVNNCILTMMHHVAGDINQVSTLFQQNIVMTFSKFKLSDFAMCDDWADLISYVVRKYYHLREKSLQVPQIEYKVDSDKQTDSKDGLPFTGWSQDDSRNLQCYYVKSERSSDPIGKVVDCYTESGVLNKTRVGVIDRLLKQELITNDKFEEFMTKEPDLKSEGIIEGKDKITPNENESLDEIKVLRDHLLNENKGKFVTWLKQSLLETCYVKLCMSSKRDKIMEPIAYHYSFLKQSTPLVPWNNEQASILQYQPFVILLNKLGMHLPSDTGKIYARIPHFWTPEILYSMAQKLGPISPDELKFDISELQMNKNSLRIDDLEPPSNISQSALFSISGSKRTNSFVSFTPGPNLRSNWIDVVQLSKTPSAAAAAAAAAAAVAPESPTLPEETEVASPIGDTDLTRMWVSDEELAVQTEMVS